MCCIFTCCGWLIDLVQRVWVFAMSFCMSGAVCCVMLTGSMSGVALGYNYSLAEYMDLKETNVSVYLKRGVFDDETLGDDITFRRSGGGENEPEVIPNVQARRAGARPDFGEMRTTLRSGRRMEDSLMESNQNHGFEGGLMKLTLAPPVPITTSKPMITQDVKFDALFDRHAPGSLEQLKDIQTLIHQRKSMAAREHGSQTTEWLTIVPDVIGEQHYVPQHVLNAQPSPGRRMWNAQQPTAPVPGLTRLAHVPADINPALFAVPSGIISQKEYWEAHKTSPAMIVHQYRTWFMTPPKPIKYQTHILIPTISEDYPVFSEATEAITKTHEPVTEKFINLGLDSGIDQVNEKLILEKYGTQRKGDVRVGKEEGTKSDIEYYDEELKGLPVRKKRNINKVKEIAPRSPHAMLDTDGNAKETNKVDHNKINYEITTNPSILIRKLIARNKMNPKTSDRNEEASKLSNRINYSKEITTNPSTFISKLLAINEMNPIASNGNEEALKIPNRINDNKVYNTESSVLISELVEKGISEGLSKNIFDLNFISSTDPNTVNLLGLLSFLVA